MLATTTRPAVPPQRRHPNTEETAAAALASYGLVQQAQTGDPDAWGRIWAHYHPVVFRFILFRVGSRPLAEDLASDALLRAYRRIGSYEWQGRDLGAWLVTIARNLVADHFKSGRYRLEVATGEVVDLDRPTDTAGVGSPEETVVAHVTNVALRAAIGQLTGRQREVIVCRFLRGLSEAETAAAVGISVGACKAAQYRAVRSLARVPGLAAWR